MCMHIYIYIYTYKYIYLYMEIFHALKSAALTPLFRIMYRCYFLLHGMPEQVSLEGQSPPNI